VEDSNGQDHEAVGVPKDQILRTPLPIPPEGRSLTPHVHDALPRHVPIQLETFAVTQQDPDAIPVDRLTILRWSCAAKLREAGEPGVADKLDTCHSFWTYQVCVSCGASHRYLNRCNQIICPSCQPALAARRAESIRAWTERIRQPKHVVLTVENRPLITASWIRDFKSWIASLRRSRFARGWRGGCWSLEVTNEGKGWHLHCHMLVDANYIDSGGLSVKWQSVTGGTGKIVHVADARRADYVREVSKYCVKGTQLSKWSAEEIVQFTAAISGGRTFGRFGSLLKADPNETPEEARISNSLRICECGESKFIYLSSLEWYFWQIERDIARNRTRGAISNSQSARASPRSECLLPGLN
jgi:hypothetical protein